MPKQKKFQPPKPTDPPKLVEIEWIDAQSEIDFEGPAKKAGGLVLLPTAGYHIRNGKHAHHGPFVVIAREWFRDEENGEVYTRDTTSIPTGWIRKWSLVTGLVEIWPTRSAELSTTTSTTSPSPKKKTASRASTISESELTAGASQKPSVSAETP